MTGNNPAAAYRRSTHPVRREKKDNMLMLVIHVLTILLWAAVTVAACGIALGFLARTIPGRTPYRNHSRPVAAAIRWEKNWHR
jgi:hypothetical protein